MATTNTAMQAIVQSNAQKLADRIDPQSEASILVLQEIENKVAARLRPIFMRDALMEILGDDFDDAPIVGSGPEGTNNPDRYLIKVTKTGVEKYGFFWTDFAKDLPVCQQYTTKLVRLDAASKQDAPADDDIQEYKSKGPKWIESEKRTVNEKLRAAVDLVNAAVRIHQMYARLEQYDTIEVNYATASDGKGGEVFDEKTTRPFVLRERYVKRGKEGQPLEDSEGNPVYTYTDKVRYLSVGEFIALEPEETANMNGGFSFDNLFKAAAVKRERESADRPTTSVRNAEQFLTGIGQTTLFITGDGYEKKIQRLVDMARKDETVLDTLMQHAMAFDAIYEELKADWNRLIQKKRDAKTNGNTKAA